MGHKMLINCVFFSTCNLAKDEIVYLSFICYNDYKKKLNAFLEKQIKNLLNIFNKLK